MPYIHTHQVQLDELDRLGHVNNTRVVQWLQDAALAHAASLGWSWDRHLALGQGWVVRSHHIDYLRPAMAGDQLRIVTWVETLDRATSKRRTRVERDNQVLVKASTLWAFVEYRSGVPRRIPPEIRSVFTEESGT